METAAPRSYGTHDVARFCQVSPPTVGRWIEGGKLPGFTTGGGHRRVWENDLVVFLRRHNIPVPAALNASHAQTFLIAVEGDAPRRAVRAALEASLPGFAVLDAADGFDAGHKIASARPALAVLDVSLPGMDGRRICRALREDARLKDLRVLVLSGDAAQERALRAAGADDFILKPFDAAVAAARAKALLVRRPVRGETL